MAGHTEPRTPESGLARRCGRLLFTGATAQRFADTPAAGREMSFHSHLS